MDPSSATENRIRAEVGAVQGFARFPTVAEITAHVERLAASSRVISADVIGESRGGRPIHQLRVGRGELHVVVVGMPHPNEPTGMLACLRLAELAAESDGWSDHTWHIVPCADPDGAVLNQGWFGGPFTRASYASHIYRPPFDEQFEWTFHRDDLAEPGLPAPPESRALMDLIDEVHPTLLATLHNGETGGFYTFATERIDGFDHVGALVRDLTGVPIERGVVELDTEPHADGVFLAAPNLTGGQQLCSTDYAARYGAVGITVEPPLWADPRAEDDAPAPLDLQEFRQQLAADRADVATWHGRCVSALEGEVDFDTPIGRAVRSDAELLSEEWAFSETGDGPAVRSVAYVTSLASWLELERLRAAGHVVRVLEAQPDLTPSTLALLDESRARLRAWSAEADARALPFVGLDAAVKCHVAITLAAASEVSHQR